MIYDNYQHWFYLYAVALFLVSCVHLLVIYITQDDSNSPRGTNLFTIYTLASLIVWLLYVLLMNNYAALLPDTLGSALVISNYLLFLAAGQHSKKHQGRVVVAILCTAATLLSLIFSGETLLWLHVFAVILCLSSAFVCFYGLARQQHNGGDTLMALATLITLVGLPISYWVYGSFSAAYHWLFGLNSLTYLTVCIGFTLSALIDTRRRLKALSTLDPVTRAPNRQGLQTSLTLSLASAARQNLSTTTLAIDIDHFRQINAAFGVNAGNQVLQQVAGHIRSFSRASDVLARDDDDCFLLVLPDTALESGKKLAERIREAIASTELTIDSRQLSVTVSLGVTCHTGYCELNDMSDKARQACQLAKRNGRNCVAALDNTTVRISGAAL